MCYRIVNLQGIDKILKKFGEEATETVIAAKNPDPHEIKYEIAMMTTFGEVKAKIDDWIDYYNNDRYQWDLSKLSPREFYQYSVTGIYPILT